MKDKLCGIPEEGLCWGREATVIGVLVTKGTEILGSLVRLRDGPLVLVVIELKGKVGLIFV